MGRPPKFQFDLDQVVDLICNRKLSIPLAAKELNCTCDALRDYVKKCDISQPKSIHKSCTPSIKFAAPEDIQELLNNRLTFKQIADKYNCKESAVASFVKLHKLIVKRYNDIPDEKTLQKLYCEDLRSIDEISSMYNVSTNRISEAINKYQIHRTAAQLKAFQEKVNTKISKNSYNKALLKLPESKVLYDEVCNTSLSAVASKYGVDINNIRKFLKACGYKYIPSKLELLSPEILQTLLDEGKTIKQIAKELNRSETTVSKYIRKYNLFRSEFGEQKLSQHRSEVAREFVLTKHQSTLPTEEELQTLVNQYYNFHEIAQLYNCGDSVIGSMVRCSNIQLPEDYNDRVIENYVAKGKQTIINTYGVFPYALTKYSSDAQQILTNKSKLEYFLESIDIEDRTIARCAADLYIPEYLLQAYISKYEINISMASKLGSSLEEQLRKFVDTFNLEYVRNTRKVITPKELDFYFPSKNLAIEVNGNWAHSSTSTGKYATVSSTYHKNKTNACSKLGIRLIHLFEYEMSNTLKWHCVQKYLKDALLEPHHRLYARNLKVFKVDNQLERTFLNDSHLQGYVGSSVCYGLFDTDELIMLMSFGKPRYNSSCKWELLRLCTRFDYLVIGGAEKLFKHFVNDYNPDSIISYCDLSKFEGKVYNKLGMKLLRISSPNYKWVRYNEVYSRYQTQRNKLSKLLGKEFDSSLSESDIMINEGFQKIYDCGNAVYEWRNEN